ncbi:MAG: extracellular solute-binding protein [Clostridiales bacterium]|nr:extracellular solute-binding protein [Clostridiales bacterium]
MRKIKITAAVLAVTMLMPILTSCSSGNKATTVVKEDDPWYESTKFKLNRDIRENEAEGNSVVCSSNDRVFSLYCSSGDLWATTRTVLDAYDLEGNLANRVEVSPPEGYYVTSIYSMSADPDGKTVNAAVYLNEAKDYGAAFVSIDTQTGELTKINNIFSKEASAVLNGKPNIMNATYIGEYIILKVFDDPGTSLAFRSDLLLFKNCELVAKLDLETANSVYTMDGYSIDPASGSLYVAAYEESDIASLEFDINNGKLKNKFSLQDDNNKSIKIAEYASTDRGELCKLDSLGNVMMIDVNDMTPKTVIDTNWYTPYFHPLETGNNLTTSSILSCTEDRTIILDTASISYGLDDDNVYEYITVLKKADKNPHAGKKVVDLALPPNSSVSEYLAKSIYEFNKTDDEYLIRIWDKYKSGFTLGRFVGSSASVDHETDKMIQDLKGGDAPDLVIGIQKNYAMRDDIFMDLTGFLDPEVLDKQYGNILDAAKVNGKQYFLPVTLEIEGLVTKADLVKDGAVGITFEDFDNMVKNDLHGFSPYDYPNEFEYNKRSFILSCIDIKSAIEGERVEFGTDQFRAAVEYAKDNFEYDDILSMPRGHSSEWEKLHKEGCGYTKMTDFLKFVYTCADSKDHYVIIGTPSIEASGPRFKAVDSISVSSATDMKDGCRKFINYLFSGAAFSSDDCEFRQIVTNKEIMSKNIATLARVNNDAYKRYRASISSGAIIVPVYVERANGDKEATDDMCQSFQDCMSTISTYYYEDQEILRFLDEEIAPYYAGDRTLDDVISVLNDRATKYIKEL